MQLRSGHQCTHTGAEYVLNNFICVLQTIHPLLRCLPDPTVIDTPWSQDPVGSPGSTVVAHRVNTCTFVVSHMCLRSMLDINGSAGELKLRSAVLY